MKLPPKRPAVAFNRIAVVLRGHLRTWPYNKNIVKKFYSSISHEVDYYVMLWDYEQTRNYDVTQDFQASELVKHQLVPIPDNPDDPGGLYNGWRGPAHLASLALPEITSRKYDMVFETRPDVIPVLNHRLTPTSPSYHDYYTTMIPIVNLQGGKPSANHACLDDWMLMMHPDRYPDMVKRAEGVQQHFFRELNTFGHQRALALYIQHLGMKIWRPKWMTTFFARPNTIEHLPNINFDEGWWPWSPVGTGPDCNKLLNYSNEWNSLSLGTKLRLLKRYNLGMEDWRNEFHWRRPRRPSPTSE